jgi:hypothetical protein
MMNGEALSLMRRVFREKIEIMNRVVPGCFAAVIFILSPSTGRACASCGCTLSSEWQNVAPPPAKSFKVDFRYDEVDQTQLRSGGSTISAGAASAVSNNGNAQEVEKYTHNHYYTLGLEYSVNPSWKVNVVVPYINRDHSTLGTGSDGASGGDGQYNSSTSTPGDIKILGRFQGFNENHNFGLIFGLKLPTGSYNQTGVSTDPAAPGSVTIDPGLQPGTGSTDLIFGISYVQPIDQNWDNYTEVLYQTAMKSRDDYRPGDGMNVNFGVRYMSWSFLKPQVQLNGRYVLHDTGASADQVSTGGTLVYLSPGVVVPVGPAASVYAFAQVPIYQFVQGVQLVPTSTASFGASYLF